MRNLTVVCTALALSAMLWVSCDRCDPIGGTRETTNKPYRGTAGATAPHYKMANFSKQCGGGACTLLARVDVHNPMNRTITADVVCAFVQTSDNSEYTIGQNSRTVQVTAVSSKAVELQESAGLQVGQSAGVRAVCHVTFR